MYGGRGSIGAPLLAVFIGAGIIWACIRAMQTREGMYDQQSSQWMFFSNIFGIILGLALMLWGIRVLHYYYDALSF